MLFWIKAKAKTQEFRFNPPDKIDTRYIDNSSIRARNIKIINQYLID